MSLIEINKRYSELAQSDCCLSCGGAINYAQPQTGEICVDLGSGRGSDAIRMAGEVGNNGFVYGIDISDGMIQKAVSTAKKLGITNTDFIQSTLEEIKLDNNVANLVISNCTINHAANKQAVWSEVYRILKKGGRFVVSDIYATAPIPDEYRNDPEAIAECWAGAVTRGEYLETLYHTGFTSVKILEESSPYAKGKAEVASFTVYGEKPGEKKSCACRGN
ncbi:MAG TPA: methyltransferase type 11 [Prolixibacteraceae bacterium]|jgi:ubiquinone/menaquinone biosynthesis C-methylase UbiE|nr:methyltransferase type 11 [Prolixibacteraceae bacterium]